MGTRKLDRGLCLSRTKNCADYDSRGFEPATLVESTPICKKFKSGECTFGNKKCWFNHEKESKDNGQKEINDKNLENNEIIQKMLQKMEAITKRITDIENSKV